MSRTRFESLMTSVHFVDNTTPTEAEKKADKYWKLRPWTGDLRKNCLKVTPEEYQSVDEIMVAFKGKSLLRQFLPAKPHKWGIQTVGQMWGVRVHVRLWFVSGQGTN